MHAPVEKGHLHGVARGLGGSRRGVGRGRKVRDRLGDAVEDDADAHAGAEQHGDPGAVAVVRHRLVRPQPRSEEHTSELQSLMRISYAVFCLKKKKTKTQANTTEKIT